MASHLISQFRLLLLLIAGCIGFAHPVLAASGSKQPEKELYLPAKISRVPEGNDFQNKESEFSFHRMVQSDNLALFWHKEYGDDPMANPDEKKRFDVQFALRECDRFYNYYVNQLKMVHKGKSISDKYKLLIFVFGGNEATAFGGGSDNKVGMLWTPAVRISKTPYGALAHEMAHSFQYILRVDNEGSGPAGAINEMSAQLLLWQVYPEWMTFENYHLVDFMKKTHYALFHSTNMYHSPYVLEYWQFKHGITHFADLSRATQRGEDPVTTYKRIHSLTQEQFNNEMFDACRRFITWDMKRIEKVARPYANQHFTLLQPAAEGWYRIDPAKCPQNYGYNGIKLQVPAAGTKVALTFKGMAGAEGYSTVKTEMAGWRYGFVASLKNGKRVYSKMYIDANGTAQFTVPKQTEYLWLVVMGAPTEHWAAGARRGQQGGQAGAGQSGEEQWPYQFKLEGTSPDNAMFQ